MLTENIHSTETSEEATTLNRDSDISCALTGWRSHDVTLSAVLSSKRVTVNARVLSISFDSTEKSHVFLT